MVITEPMNKTKAKQPKPNSQTVAQGQDPARQAVALFQKLEQERGKSTISLNTAVKGYSTRALILAAEPEVHVEFVRQVVADIAKRGKSTGKIGMISAWFHDLTVPYGAEEMAKQLMRRRLPFTDAALAEMVEQIGRMDFVTFAPVLEPLVRELEKRSAEGALSSKVRKGLPKVIKGLLVKGWSADEKENWGLPRAVDVRLAERIGKLAGR